MSSGEVVRHINEKRALTALFRSGGLTRAQLARALSLTRATTGNLVQSLTDDGCVRDCSLDKPLSTTSNTGRPGTIVDIASDGAFFIGAYIGVDRLTVTSIDLKADTRSLITEQFDGAGCSPHDAISRIAGLLDRITVLLPNPGKLRGISIALPGFLGKDGTDCHAAILDWHGLNFLQLLEKSIGKGVPLMVENDANCYAIAEHYRGLKAVAKSSQGARDSFSAEQDKDTLVMLIENGVGAGILNSGKLLRGRGHRSGEIGHMQVGDQGFITDHERPGRLESYIGREALLARYCALGGKSKSFEHFLKSFDAGKVAAVQAAEDWAYWVSRGVSALLSVLELQRVVIGGSVGSPMFLRMEASILESVEHSLPRGYPAPTLTASDVGPEGAALGAAYLLHDKMLSKTSDIDIPTTMRQTTIEG